MGQAIQKGYKFYGGPLNGDYLEMDLGESFDMEALEYSEIVRLPHHSPSVHRYERRFLSEQHSFAYVYAGQPVAY